MKMNRNWIGWTLGLVAVCVTVTAAAALDNAVHTTNGASAIEKTTQPLASGGHGRAMHRFAAARFLRKLGLSDAQRALALQEAKSTQPIVDAARRDAARILVDADDAKSRGERVDVRGELEALRGTTLAKLEPMAQRVIDSLSPEQRKTIEDASTKRGRAFDAKRLVRRTARLLARPMTAAILEARLTR
jgi:hypothetical protein